MAFTSTGLGQTCSSSISARWCAKTSRIPSIRSVPKAVFFSGAFLGILLHSFQTIHDLPQFSLFVRGQIRSDALCITAQQVDARGDHNVQIDDPCAAALSLALRSPPQLPRSAGAGIVFPASG